MSRKYNSEQRENWMYSIYPPSKFQKWHSNQVFLPPTGSYFKEYKRYKAKKITHRL